MGITLFSDDTQIRTTEDQAYKRTVFFSSSSGGWGKIKLNLTTLPRIFIRVVCRFNSVAFATQRELAHPSNPTVVIA